MFYQCEIYSFLKKNNRWCPFLHTASQLALKLSFESIIVPKYLYDCTLSTVWPLMYVTLCMGTFFLKINYHVFSLQYIQVKVGLLTPLYKVTDGWSMNSLTILKQTNNYSIICILNSPNYFDTYSCRVWTIKTKVHILVGSQWRK